MNENYIDWIYPFYHHDFPFELNSLNEICRKVISHHNDDATSPLSLFSWLPFDRVLVTHMLMKSIDWRSFETKFNELKEHAG